MAQFLLIQKILDIHGNIVIKMVHQIEDILITIKFLSNNTVKLQYLPLKV